jgi:hypothetical protein
MKIVLKLMMLLALVSALCAQESPKGKQEQSTGATSQRSTVPALPDVPYKVDVSIFELDGGKHVNQRDYSLMITDSSKGSITIGTRVPVTTGEKQFQYIDVGLELDCLLQEMTDNKLSARINLHLSSFALPEQNTDPRTAGAQPVLRRIDQQLRAVLIPGKSQIVSSIDDVNSSKRMQVEIKATKLD